MGPTGIGYGERKRAILEFVGSEKELEMEAFRMASGGEANWRVARDEGLQRTLLGILCKWLEAQDMGEKDLDGIPEGQPLQLRLLRRLLESAAGPDREFLRDAEEGLPVGIRYPLPRTPHVFEEQLRWPLDNQPWEPGLRWVPNYGSVEEHVEFARAKFEEDITEGLMLKMSLGDF